VEAQRGGNAERDRDAGKERSFVAAVAQDVRSTRVRRDQARTAGCIDRKASAAERVRKRQPSCGDAQAASRVDKCSGTAVGKAHLQVLARADSHERCARSRDRWEAAKTLESIHEKETLLWIHHAPFTLRDAERSELEARHVCNVSSESRDGAVRWRCSRSR